MAFVLSTPTVKHKKNASESTHFLFFQDFMRNQAETDKVGADRSGAG